MLFILCGFGLSEAASLATIIGVLAIPITIATYIYDQRKQRTKEANDEKENKKKKEMEIFNSLNSEWRNFLQICLQYPELDFSQRWQEKKEVLSTENKRKYIMNEVLLSMFEVAHRNFKDLTKDELEVSGWDGWNNYLKDWINDPQFASHCWNTIKGKYYSPAFEKYLEKTLIENGLSRPPDGPVK